MRRVALGALVLLLMAGFARITLWARSVNSENNRSTPTTIAARSATPVALSITPRFGPAAVPSPCTAEVSAELRAAVAVRYPPGTTIVDAPLCDAKGTATATVRGSDGSEYGVHFTRGSAWNVDGYS